MDSYLGVIVDFCFCTGWCSDFRKDVLDFHGGSSLHFPEHVSQLRDLDFLRPNNGRMACVTKTRRRSPDARDLRGSDGFHCTSNANVSLAVLGRCFSLFLLRLVVPRYQRGMLCRRFILVVDRTEMASAIFHFDAIFRSCRIHFCSGRGKLDV